MTVDPTPDTIDEPNETVVLTVTFGMGYTVDSPNSALASITDDDPTPSLSINDSTVSEPSMGTVAASFTVTLSAASSITVAVSYVTAGATAVAPDDYQVASGALIFTPGQTTQIINVLVKADALAESTESFSVQLSNPFNAVFSNSTGLGTILNL